MYSDSFPRRNHADETKNIFICSNEINAIRRLITLVFKMALIFSEFHWKNIQYNT